MTFDGLRRQDGDWGTYLSDMAGGSDRWRRLCNASNNAAKAGKLNQVGGPTAAALDSYF